MAGADLRGLRVALVGPVPPPSGGMANQVLQLERLLRSEGVTVEVVPVNRPYWPAWIGAVPGVRAAARLLPYMSALHGAAGRADVVHVLASSGWSWHLFAAPAVWISRARGVPVVVNYRGGGAGPFLARAAAVVRPTLRRASALVVPSEFLREVFARHGFSASVVPNVIDAERFAPAPDTAGSARFDGAPAGPHILIPRNLEPVYDVATGLRAFKLVRERHPAARLSVVGTGPERARLEALAKELGLGNSVRFVGRVENDAMPALYRETDVMLNPSLADNMPISILESLASGVPIVTTNVGGIPFLVRERETALLVSSGDEKAMAAAIEDLWSDKEQAARQSRAGLALAQEYTWARIRERWAAVYRGAQAAGSASQVAAR
ncbi:MAG TPA: glycosyltransferase family 4 protein [Candidatus Eisenbacteria bacterium]|nr:glycosyltransferase family 4 protein [Candidatus Eisenbacteria bacterium]